MNIVKGDTLKSIRFRFWTLNQTGTRTPLDLTDCDLQAKWKISGGTQKVADLTVLDPPTNGVAELAPAATNWDAPGIAIGRVYITSGSMVGKTFRWQIYVEDDS